MVASRNRRISGGFVLLTVCTLAAVIALVSLGNWQVRRLTYKTQLAAIVTQRLTAPPTTLPPSELWSAMDPEAVDYTPVRLSGHYLLDHEFHVFTTLTEAHGPQSGVGWWIFSPFVEPDGTEVIVNRGFVPDTFKDPSTRPQGQIAGHITLTGLLRRPEGSNVFTPANDVLRNRWFTRDPLAMARSLLLPADKILPFYIDAAKDMTPAGGLPQAGETIVDFSNNHLGYALTWYGLALAAAGVYAAFAWRRMRLPD